MRFVSDNRASRILYNLLSSNTYERPFLIPANVCEVIPQVFSEAQVKIEYADIDSNHYCLDFNHLLYRLREYSGALFVHTYGIEYCDEVLFSRIKNSNPHFIIIDDRCLCTPNLEYPQTNADICLYSVGEKKQVDMGRGGFAYLQESLNYERCGLKSESFMDDSFWAFEYDTIQKKTYESLQQRILINSIYETYLPKDIQFSGDFQNWRFNIFVKDKQRVLNALFNKGLFASSHYRPLVDNCPNANTLHNHVINLFNDFHYSEEMALETCRIINDII